MSLIRFVGIDISKDRLDVHVRPDQQRWQLANDADGIEACLERLQELAPELIVMEATGGLQLPLLAALPAVAVNPR